MESSEPLPEPSNETHKDTESVSELSQAQKLIKHLTGLDIGDPKLIDRLERDKSRIRAKYDLPPGEMKPDAPSEYEHQLKLVARKYGTEIVPRHAVGRFFEENPHAGAAHFPEQKRVAVDIDRETLGSYMAGLGDLEHELIHAIQGVSAPRMPIEQQEYEAYVGANLSNIDKLRSDPDRIEALEDLFSFIGGSIRHWYHEESEKRGEEIRPSWAQ